MSTAEAPDVSDFAKTAVALLKEYCEKVTARRKSLRKLQLDCEAARENKDSFNAHQRALLDTFLNTEIQSALKFRSAVDRAARRISQHIEHVAPSDSSTVELELRLAELEESARVLAQEANAIQQWTVMRH